MLKVAFVKKAHYLISTDIDDDKGHETSQSETEAFYFINKDHYSIIGPCKTGLGAVQKFLPFKKKSLIYQQLIYFLIFEFVAIFPKY